MKWLMRRCQTPSKIWFKKADLPVLGLWFSGNLLASNVQSSWVRFSPQPSSGGGAGWGKGCRSFLFEGTQETHLFQYGLGCVCGSGFECFWRAMTAPPPLENLKVWAPFEKHAQLHRILLLPEALEPSASHPWT